METVITLIADVVKEALSERFVEGMAPSLALSGHQVEKVQWLEKGVACDVFLQAGDIKALDAAVAAIVADQPYDAVVQPVENRKKKLLISDMDSTMITVECIDELADFVGKKAEVAIITDKAMNGELVFEAALRERVALLKDLPVGVLQQCYDERVVMMKGAKELVGTMRANGAQAVLVSGGFTFFTSRVRGALGFHEDHSNVLEVAHGVLTGRVIPPILGKEAKLATLKEQCGALGITPAEVLAVGDGANDLPMLMAAGLGVAYHAKPVVRAQANARISHTNLSALLYVQGYAKGEWVS
jgi:phosphoserine phosphatase